jgi:hypothetical protein
MVWCVVGVRGVVDVDVGDGRWESWIEVEEGGLKG